jgi:hypothetical protein
MSAKETKLKVRMLLQLPKRHREATEAQLTRLNRRNNGDAQQKLDPKEPQTKEELFETIGYCLKNTNIMTQS